MTRIGFEHNHGYYGDCDSNLYIVAEGLIEPIHKRTRQKMYDDAMEVYKTELALHKQELKERADIKEKKLYEDLKRKFQ